jgi:ankyrin repeat protein
MACINKCHEAAKVLLEAGADIDPQDKWGNTPLWRATFFGEDGTVELVQLLIDHGADPTIDNHSGISALNLARQVRKVNYLTVFEHRQGQ